MNRSNRSWVVVVAVGLAGCLGETEMVGGPQGSGGGVADPGPAPGGGEGGGVAQGGGTGTFTGPARLVMTLEPSVTSASLGQKVVVNVRVSNVGASTAVQVAPRTPLQTGTGRAALKQAPTPASVDLPSGAEHVFTFEYETTDAGAWSLEGYADGLDADLEQAVTAGPVRAEVLIHGAALLTAESLSAPARAMVGESFTVTLVVKNGGQGDARSVKPTLSFGAAQVTVLSGPTPATADLAAGTQAQFTFSCRVDAAGSVVPHAQAAGVDASSLQPVSTMAIDGAPIDVDSPARLEADLMLPAAITQGSTFSATLVVRNTGTSAARGLVALPAAPAVTQGAATLQAGPATAAFDLPGGGSAPMTWTFTATTAGPLAMTIAVQGTDDRSGAAVKSALATSNTAQVGAAPSLQVTALAVPAAITRGQRFPVSVTVKNTGGAALTAVVPQPLPLQPSVAGGAKATTTTVPAPKDLAPGASATFAFDFLETGTGPGSLTFAAGASAVVAPAGASVTAPTSVPQVVSVQAPADLTVESITLPLRLSRGQAFTAAVVVRNNGAAAASQVKLTTPAQVIATGGAGAMAGAAPAAVDLAAGASASFTLAFTETGTAAGTLKLALTATGTDAVSGAALSSPTFTSPTAVVEAPAQLVVTSLSLPASLTRGSTFSVSMTVANQGQATATNVRPALPLTATATGGAAATAGTAPAAVTLAGGASTTFTLPFTESGTAVGSLTFAGKALGTDANGGAALSSSQVSSAAAQVVAPSSLTVTGITVPATLTRGQAFQVVVTVKNSGGSSLTSVLPSPSPLTVLAQGSAGATVTSSPAAQTVAAGASATFTYGYAENGSGAGTLSLTAGARGTDSGTGGTITATAVQSNVATVQVPAVLVVDSVTVPARLSRGMRFDATVVVRNSGGSNATNVRLGTLAPTATGGAAASTASAPAAVTLAPGATTSFTYSYLEAGTGPGTWALTAAAAGTDSATGGALSSPSVTSAVLTVQAPAALTATLSAPASVARGASFPVSLTVTNSGQATANAVLPVPSPVSVALTGGAAAGTTTSPVAVTLAGGASQTFTYVFTESGTAAGSLTFSAAARGTDANSALAVSSPTATSATQVVAPGALQVLSLTAPATIARGQAFTATLVVKNTGGASLNAVAPSPLKPSVAGVGGAGATTATSPAAQTIAAGAQATFTWAMTENGTAAGSFILSAGAAGTDSATGAAVSAAPLSSASTSVVEPAKLVVEPITLVSRLSRGQGFSAVIAVRNDGGASATGVRLSSLPLTVTGTANAATASAPAAVTLAPGGRTTFTYVYTENGSGPGTLQLTATASGLDAVTGAAVSSAAVPSNAITVETPASLAISSFQLPASVAPGGTFTLSLTVFNTGQATAVNVLPVPAPPSATATGGVTATTASTVTAVSIPGNSSQTFTWSYTASATATGTLAFTGGARGADGNSGLAVATANAASNVASVGSGAGCNGSTAYTGLGGRSLTDTRLDLPASSDRLRVKPYDALVPEMTRMLGTTPSSINNKGTVFNAPPERWWNEPEMAAISVYQLMRSSFQGCLSYTSSPAAYAANPTSTTAQTECTNFQRKFWARTPTSTEVQACASFAMDPTNNDSNPRRRWAYVCAAVMTSANFIAD